MIELNEVTKLYKLVIGVNDVTLSLAPGAYGLLGPNGSGKSTLLNLITGQLRPTRGTVKVLGRNPWGNAYVMRNIGLCPERDALHSNVTALEWVSYLLELHGMSPSEAAEHAADALAKTGMQDAMNRAIGGYSLGMRQRTKLAQAFAHQPQLLILDEPFNGLDPVGRHDMTELLLDWIDQGRSLLLASHVLHEVEAITKQFLLIRGGRLLASGSAEEVHQLLADLPSEIRIRCDKPRQLAQRFVEQGAVDGVTFDKSGDTVIISTKHPASLYDCMPKWTSELNLKVHEITSGEESLQALFTQLMKMNRGEA